MDDFYFAYLKGNEEEARSNLVAAADFIQGKLCKFPELAQSAQTIFARRALLEHLCGNDLQARLFFEKARYESLNIMEHGNVSLRRMIDELNRFTPEFCYKFASDWDDRYTEGRGPKFRESLAKKVNTEGNTDDISKQNGRNGPNQE